jgi:transposase-like protein
MELNHHNFHEHFPDDQACLEFLTEQRWPDGVCCLYCGSVAVYPITKRNIYECKDCSRQFSAKTGTPFERSRIPLTKWFRALFMLTSDKRGVSSVQVAKAVGVTQKTAWHMMHDLRDIMGEEFQLMGSVELDETYIHPNTFKRSSARKKYGMDSRRKGKIVFGMMERGGRVKMIPVKSSGTRSLMPLIERYIKKGSRIYSDEWGVYRTLDQRGYGHLTTNHSSGEYAVGDIHSQGIENTWSHLKRSIKGTYYHVSDRHLRRYCDEVSFRFNYRRLSQRARFGVWFANLKNSYFS